ncbi:BspA family leucine-rich repeat surface protein [Flavobacteriaceae bacterium]|nr:BspA family leucine-rich repeat surface protein [Flavobacteriaceae bacterium]
MIKKKQLLELGGHMFLLFSLFSVSGMTAQQTYTLDWGFNINGENASLTIETGDTVQWIWVDGGGHSVTSTPSSQESFDSGILQGAGSTYSYTFTQEGVNEYVCTPHSATMFGTITVASSLNDFFLAPNGVTCMCPNAAVGDSGDPGDGIVYTKRIRSQINSQNAATTCTSGITDMSALFYDNSNFNEDISSWDVSSVTNMSLMFFENSSFNQSIGLWNVGSVTDMSYLFTGTPFNNPIGDWNVGSVTSMREMFNGSVNFNQAINNWDVSSVTDMGLMFRLSPFNQAIGNWDVGNVTTMAGMFAESQFNQPISSWDVSNVTNMADMFIETPFNYSIENWDVSSVTIMFSMFRNTPFNQPLGDWDVSSVTNTSEMFADSPFNQLINDWDVSNVTDMAAMFYGANSFNQPLGDWDVSSVTNMDSMFNNANSFNQDISNWQFNTNVGLSEFLDNTGIDINNYDALLEAFSNQTLVNKTLGAQGLTYCNVSAREDLITNKGWIITGDSYSQPIITAPNNLNIDPDPSSCVAANIDLGAPTITGGCGTQTISNDAPNEFPIGTTQVLWTLVDGSGIETTDTQTVTVTLQVDVADVCYVSSDQTQVANNRIFITNDPANSGLNVAYYDVLRESQSGAYESIGFITPPEVSFLDIESNNASQAYRYKIRTTDVCGANYPESSFHKTILLQSGIASDNSINLSWTPYLGLDFNTYNIYKNTNGTGYALLTSLSFNNTTYNDTSANVVDNFYEYYISIEVASCGSDPLLPFNLRSNLELVNPNLSITNTNWLNQEIQIYPNPTSDYINISFPNQIEITTVSIYNALGQLVFDTNKYENIPTSELSTGLYYLSILTNRGFVNKTMIKQ